MRRFLGPTRFHLGAIWELLKGKNYKCRCFILPPEAAPAATNPTSTSTPNGPAGNAAASTAADATTSSAASDATPLLNRLQKTPTSELRGSAAGLGLSQPTRLSDYPSGPPLPVLSQLSTLPGPLPDTPAPLPPGWVQLSDVNSFAMFLGINPQFTSLDARINPGGSFGDGGLLGGVWGGCRARRHVGEILLHDILRPTVSCRPLTCSCTLSPTMWQRAAPALAGSRMCVAFLLLLAPSRMLVLTCGMSLAAWQVKGHC